MATSAADLPLGLRDLASIVGDWAAPASNSLTVYIFGSRVRGDHRVSSDVDIYMHVTSVVDDAALAWHCHQQTTSYAELRPLLPGPLGENGSGLLDPMDDDMVRLVLAGRLILSDRNVRCVWLPPKPRRENQV